MWWKTFLLRWRGSASSDGRSSARRCRLRPTLEALEDRTLPSSYTAATVPELIASINAANQTPEADIIVLAAGSRFTLTEVNHTVNGATGLATGLPAIAATEDLTIVGNGDVIERSTATGTPAFRLFDVAAGASLRLANLTVQGGWAVAGGGIYSEGSLTLKGVTVQNNIASGGWAALGGGIYSSGSLNLENTVVQKNQALGPTGVPYQRGDAFGGGLYIGRGTALLTGVTLSGNTAMGGDGFDGRSGGGADPEGGNGGPGGNGFGGGLYAVNSSIELHNVTVTSNTAKGGAGGHGGKGHPAGKAGPPGLGIGGGLFIEANVLACLDAFTVDHVKGNKASTSDPNIRGSYTICP